MKQQLTKAAIEDAFIKLLAEKPFEKVTVKDIVDCCGLTRNTFYYYFEDTFDIVDEILTGEIEKQLSDKTEELTPDDVLHACLRFAVENPKLVNHIFMSPKRDELKIYFAKAEQIVIERYISSLSSGKNINSEDRAIIRDFCRHCVDGMLEDWIKSGRKYDLDERIHRVSLIFGDVLRAAVERAAE